ncbi:hypothetical protein Taro_036956 [Colocasia esculenta]|uniref:Uncharacterized protein n=1 Tax=Colocasia esculenta TaxID=4460 RepID=A0A843VZ26_COLES|nr:hypothetical protein [Colocasia esculenta]
MTERESHVLGYNRLVDLVGIHGQRKLMEALNKDLLVRQKEYPTESSSKSRESVYIETSARHSRGILEQWSIDIGIPKTSRETMDKYRVLGYNRLVDHVGIHGQRRLTEALNKDLLVR